MFLAAPAYSPEPNRKCNKPHNRSDENSRSISFLTTGFTPFAAISKTNRAWARVIHFITISATTIVFSLPASGISALALSTERYDFGGTDNGLPDHLQAVYGHLAIEYVVKDHAGAGLETRSGRLFQNRITGDAFDIPWKIFVSFPLKKDKIFGVIGLGGALYQDPIVAPGGGLIWLFSDNLRLEGVFPKPALVYDLNDDWQFRIAANLAYESFRTDDVFTPLHKLREHNAVVQYHETRAGLQVSYSGIKHLKITAAAGCTIVRDFDFFRVGVSERTDPAPYVQLSADLRF